VGFLSFPLVSSLLGACAPDAEHSGTSFDDPPLTELPIPSGTPALPEPATAPDLDPADGIVSVSLVADEMTFERAGITIDGYAFNGQVPGPTIRAKVGDVLEVEVTNDLDEETTVHWHGVEVPWDQDGIAWMSDPIAPGETRLYTFPLTRAGTFWYHPHMDVAHQVDWGLYGALIVTDPSEPATDVDRVFVIDDWSEPDEDDGDEHHADTTEGVWTVNGVVGGQVVLDAGTTTRARFLNVSNHGYVDLDPGGRVIADDQGLMAGLGDEAILGPGDRIEVEWDGGTTAWDVIDHPYTLAGATSGWMADETLFHVATEGSAASASPVDWPFADDVPTADPLETDVLYVLQGDGDSFLINGEVYPDVTIQEIPLAAPSIVEVRNLSGTEHTFHLHGMRFELLSLDGVPPVSRSFEDTVNIPIRSVARLRVEPTHAGDWMAHCHILDHEHLGMMTVLRVDP
jgi:FtsP/CotA-like multicopper oxidase with cupredoxin domain